MKVIEHVQLRLIASAAILVAGLSSAGGAQAMSLMEAYQSALAHDPTYQEAVQDAAAGKEYKVLGRSSLLPNVQASYAASRNRADQFTHEQGMIFPSHPQYISRDKELSLRQPLFSLDAWARYKQGVAQSNYSDENFEGRAQELITRVVGAYVDALFANEQLRLSQVQRDFFAEQKAVNDHLFEKGEGTRTDMLETQSRLELAEAQLIEAQDNATVSFATLSTIVGQEVTSLDELASNFPFVEMPEGGYEAWRKIALERNPDIRAQNYAIEAAKQDVARSRAGHTPRLDMVASYSKDNAASLNTYTQDSTNRAVGFQLTVPLYSGGSVSATTRQSAAGLEKARAELQLRIDKVLVEVRKQHALVLSSVARIHALERAVASGELLVTATQQSIKGGVRINLDLLNARQQLFTSQRDLAQARYTYLLSLLRLRAAAGVASPDDVLEVSRYFRH